MRIIAVTNIKGGVGKTTTAVNLAYLCAASGRATLLWDLDPQGAASYGLGIEPHDQPSAKKLVNGKRELPELVLASGYPGLDLIPADFSYRNFALHLARQRHPTERLLRMSRSLRDIYHTLILDCPAGISLLTENVLRAADCAIVPLVPSPLSVRVLGQLYEFLLREEWTDLTLLPFFSMADRRRALHAQLMAETRARFPQLLTTHVPYWSEIERMTQRRAPLPAFAPQSAAAHVYARLWAEMEERMRGEPRAPASQPLGSGAARGAGAGVSVSTMASTA